MTKFTKMKKNLKQSSLPYVWAVDKYVKEKRIPFHMPGHKQGKGVNSVIKKMWGEKVFSYDLTEVDGLDYLNAPNGVIGDAEALAAKAFGVVCTFFLINGSTVGNQAAILASVRPGEKILIPRNSHQSTYAGLILSGAVPVYVNATLHERSGLYPVVSESAVIDAFKNHPDIKAVHITSPTHCGFVSSTEKIGKFLYRKKTIFIVDEAHGSHFVFNSNFPKSSIGTADIVIQSTHKTLGSLTQTSMLHLPKENKIKKEDIQKILRILQSSSPSTILVMSLDAARQQMSMDGKVLLGKTLRLARQARIGINSIPGFHCYGREVIGTDDIYDIDETKLLIDVSDSGYSGIELEKILGRRHKIEIEMSDEKNILCFLTIGDSEESVSKLIFALKSIKLRKMHDRGNFVPEFPQIPDLVVSPREAFFAKKKRVSLFQAIGEVSGEFLIPFPPDIPIIAPGERITKEIVDYVAYLKKSGIMGIGPKDMKLENIEILIK